MNIYQIDDEIQNILSATDENGELPEEAITRLVELNRDRDEKIENAACMCVNLTSEAKAIREQELILAKRRAALEHRADRIKLYLEYATGGEAFASPRVAIRYTHSTAVEINDEVFWDCPDEVFVRVKREPDKTAITDALKKGAIIPGARLVHRDNIMVK